MLKAFNNGLLDSNTYVYSTDTGHAMIIDFGVPVNTVLEYVKEKNLTVDYLVLTHGHYDHINYIGDYQKAFGGAKIICHKDELQLIRDPEGNISSYFGLSNSYDIGYNTVRDGDIISLKNGEECTNFEVIHAPGHTPGCICIYEPSEKIMFTGDVVFANGYGRTDFKYASLSDMLNSLRRIFQNYKGTKIFPGHYESAVI